MELFQVNRQWSKRPADERYLDLYTMRDHFEGVRNQSKEVKVSTHKIEARPVEGDPWGLQIFGPNGTGYTPTHWAFGQLAQQAASPARYLRTLPGALAADCLNWKLQFAPADEVKVLLQKSETANTLRAVTGPDYGRIWNMDFVSAIVNHLGDGRTGDFRVPGEFGKPVEITERNTTLYASDQDVFIFLADEEHRIDVPNRRNGQPGSLSRGIFFWNSEVGDGSIGMAFFLFDYACSNRIVWGAQQFKEIRIRHTASAPDRWMDEILPVIAQFGQSSVEPIETTLAEARKTRIDEKLETFLATRFGKPNVEKIIAAHAADEGRPMETVWDVVTGATAWAREIKNNDARLVIEREAGKVLDLVAA